MKIYKNLLLVSLLVVLTACSRDDDIYLQTKTITQEFSNKSISQIENDDMILELNSVEYNSIFLIVTMTVLYKNCEVSEYDLPYKILPELKMDDVCIPCLAIEEVEYGQKKYMFDVDFDFTKKAEIVIESITSDGLTLNNLGSFGINGYVDDIYNSAIECGGKLELTNKKNAELNKIVFAKNGIFLEVKHTNEDNYIIIAKDKYDNKYYFLPYISEEESIIYRCNIYDEKRMKKVVAFSEKVNKLEFLFYDGIKLSNENIDITSDDVERAKISKKSYNLQLFEN